MQKVEIKQPMKWKNRSRLNAFGIKGLLKLSQKVKDVEIKKSC